MLRVSSLPFLFNLLKHLFSLYFHFFLSQFCYCRSNCIPSTGFVNSNLALGEASDVETTGDIDWRVKFR